MASRVEKLAAKGTIAFEVDGVLGRLTRKQSIDVDLSRELGRFVQAGAIIGAAVKRRMRDERTYADGSTWSPSRRSSHFRVSAKYARNAGFIDRQKKRSRVLLREAGGRARWARLPGVGFGSLAEMYAASKSSGAFDVTGGMWHGFVARPWGRLGVRLAFDGTSQGRGKFKEFGRDLHGNPIWVKASESVRNWKKAGAVFLSLNRNIIEISEREALSIASAVGSAAVVATAKRMDSKPALQVRFDGDPALARKLAELLMR